LRRPCTLFPIVLPALPFEIAHGGSLLNQFFNPKPIHHDSFEKFHVNGLTTKAFHCSSLFLFRGVGGVLPASA
jgi:hypothetical protein